MTRMVLASASSGRLRVLRQAGVDPLVIVSGVDEDAVVAGLPPGSDPATVTTALAEAKANAVLAALPAEVAADGVVVGCDSMLLRDGRLRGKPGDPAAAALAWAEMAGGEGELVTGHCLIRVLRGTATDHVSAAASTRVRFGSPGPADLAAYVASGEPEAVAGGFTLDGRGGWFVDGIEGDPSTVIGIGLPTVAALLARIDVTVAGLWRDNPVQRD